MEVLPVFLKLGQPVNLEGFGTFRVSVTSDGTATLEELNARHVKGVKLLFLPFADLKRNLEGITLEVPPQTPPAGRDKTRRLRLYCQTGGIGEERGGYRTLCEIFLTFIVKIYCIKIIFGIEYFDGLLYFCARCFRRSLYASKIEQEAS
jgi:hypothetical protein